MQGLYITEIYRPVAVPLPLIVCVCLECLHSLLHSELRKKAMQGQMVRCGRPRSLEVIEIGTNRKLIFDFLLVYHCNYVSMSSIISEIQQFISRKSGFLPFYRPSPRQSIPWELECG